MKEREEERERVKKREGGKREKLEEIGRESER